MIIVNRKYRQLESPVAGFAIFVERLSNMMRRLSCIECPETDTYSNLSEAFMDGWKLDNGRFMCPKCVKFHAFQDREKN